MSKEQKEVIQNQEENFEIITRDIQGVAKVHAKREYKEHTIIIRQIFENYFEYLVTPFNSGDIYSTYMILTPPENTDRLELTEGEILEGVAVILTGAKATVDASIMRAEELAKQEKKSKKVKKTKN